MFLLIAGPARSPSSSIFFINLMMFRCLVGIPMRMVIPHGGIRFYIFRWVITGSVPKQSPLFRSFLDLTYI